MVHQADLSGIVFILPILSFLLVFVVVFAILNKTKIIESKWVQLFVSFVFATIFVSAFGPREYVLNLVPWLGVLVVVLFITLALTGFIGEDIAKNLNKPIGWTFIIILIVLLITTAIFVFASYLSPYLPGSSGEGANPQTVIFFNWLFSSSVLGALLLIVVGAIASWILVKAK